LIQHLADAALALAALGCVFFVVAYHLLAPWRSSPVGRNVMAFMACCALLLCIGVVRVLFGLSDTAIQWVRLVGFLIVAYVAWRRVYLLIRAQFPERTRS
jgi:hypothetical protein